MTTLALDLGQTVGWIKGRAVGPLEYGSFNLDETTDLGKWLRSADKHMDQLFTGVDSVVMEQPFLGENYYPARKIISLLGHFYYYAGVAGIPGTRINEIAIASGKLALSGNGRAEKEDMIAAACDWYGFEPDEIDEHIADASGLLKFHFYGSGPPKRKPARSGPGRSILKGDVR